jgi:GR25 family glycosyltransferase involved in LPS biosynthesis
MSAASSSANCPVVADATTDRMRNAALSQLRSLGGEDLRSSWRLDSFFDRIYVISLPTRPDRRTGIVRALARHGSRRVEFFEAVDGSRVVSQEPERWRNRMMTDELDPLPYAEGQIGCLLSHYAVHRSARQAGLRSYLVLEDDAVLRPAAGKRFRQAMAQLPGDWDALYLGYNRYFVHTRDCYDRAAHEARCPGSGGGGGGGEPAICRARANLLHTHAIAYHARAYDWLVPLLSKVEEGPSTRVMPIDLEMRFRFERDRAIRVYAVVPSPIVAQNRSISSNIFVKRGMYDTRKRFSERQRGARNVTTRPWRQVSHTQFKSFI